MNSFLLRIVILNQFLTRGEFLKLNETLIKRIKELRQTPTQSLHASVLIY